MTECLEDLLELGASVTGEGFVLQGQQLSLLFKGVELGDQFAVGREGLAQPDESAHHVDRHFHGARRIEHGGGHDCPVLRKGEGELAAATASRL